MRAIDFVLETLSHFAREVEGPPPGVPFHADAEFETDLVLLCQHQRVSAIVSESFDELALPPTISRITIARIKQHAEALELQRGRRLELAVRIAGRFATAGIRSALLGDVWTASKRGLVARLRPVGKVDMMIDESQWTEAVGALRDIGFVRSRIQPRLSAGSAEDALRYHQYFAPLVMHNHDGDAVALRFRVIDFGHPGRENPAWERVAHADVGSAKATIVGAEDRLINSVVSFGAEGFVDLLTALDTCWLLNRYADALDWGYVSRCLRARGLNSTFFLTLEHICDLLNIQRATEYLEKPGNWRRRVFQMCWRLGDADFSGETEPMAGRFTYGLIECGGPLSKLLWLRRALFPRAAWVKSVYGRPANLWLRLKFLHDVRSGRRRRAVDPTDTRAELSNIHRLR